MAMTPTERTRAWRAVKKADGTMAEYTRASYLQGYYKMTIAEYDALLNAQGGVCAICKNGSVDSRALAVDHDWSCCNNARTCGGCIRGLLCMTCNTMLGKMEKRGVTVADIEKYLCK